MCAGGGVRAGGGVQGVRGCSSSSTELRLRWNGHIMSNNYYNRTATQWFHICLAMKASFTTAHSVRVNRSFPYCTY